MALNEEVGLGLEFLNYYSDLTKKKFTLKEINRVFGGASKETYKVKLFDANKEEVNLIYRRSQKSSLIETDQLTEYSAYLAFQDSSVPVPRTIAIEETSDKLGAPFIIMEELKGLAASPFDSSAYSPFEEAIGKKFWKILAEITLKDISDPAFTNLDGPKDNEKPWKRELDHWVKVINSDSIGVEPILEAAIRHLYKKPPQDSLRKCLVHGDYRNGNFLTEGEDITGILDWEMAHIGDPLEDLAWALSPIWSWEDHSKPAYLIDREEALRIWSRSSQIEIDKEDLSWWELFSCVKGLAIWISAGHEFTSGDNTDPINLFSAWIPGDIHTEIILNTLEKELN